MDFSDAFFAHSEEQHWIRKHERVWAAVTEVGWGEFTTHRALNLVLTEDNINRGVPVTLCMEKTVVSIDRTFLLNGDEEDNAT